MASHRFWPFAHTHYVSYPTTLNDSGAPLKTIEQNEFLHQQIQTESDTDHYSAPFSPDLLPGMYSTPILAVLRKGKFCLCNHHSYRKFSLTSMIDQDNIARVKLDGIRELGKSLCIFRRQHGNEPLVIFKSDVKAAYHRMASTISGKSSRLLHSKAFIVWIKSLVSAAEVLKYSSS